MFFELLAGLIFIEPELFIETDGNGFADFVWGIRFQVFPQAAGEFNVFEDDAIVVSYKIYQARMVAGS